MPSAKTITRLDALLHTHTLSLSLHLSVSMCLSVFLCSFVRFSAYEFLSVCLCVCLPTKHGAKVVYNTREKAKAFTICCHTFNIYNYQTNTAAGYLLFSIQLMQTLRNLVSIFPSGYPFFFLSFSEYSCNVCAMCTHIYICTRTVTKRTKKPKKRKRQIQTPRVLQSQSQS